MANLSTPLHIALVSMPWSLFNRPSIQLGSLKAFIEKNIDISVDCYHPYLGAARSIGVDTYSYISKNSWAGEAIFSAILFPARKDQAKSLFEKACTDNRKIAKNFDNICEALNGFLADWVNSIDFSGYCLTGFSVCFSQLFSSLAAAQKIKEQCANAPIVFGGSSCLGKMGQSLRKNFPQVDHVIEGEGEEQLSNLCCNFHQSNSLGASVEKGQSPTAQREPHSSLDFDKIPTPNYHSYFDELERVFPGKPFSPKLPIEFSRGCWWRKCSFCNLNIQWHGYRKKSADKVLDEVAELYSKYQCLDFTFCDNALPLRETDHFFTTIQDWDIDLRFFAEVRAIDDPVRLANYRRAGLTTIQVGIESLSSSLLKKMEKGTSVIENIAIMKHCAEKRISLDGNIILEFPGSTRQEVEETLVNLDYVLPYRPLSTATFFLGAGSPVDKNPDRYGIKAIINHPNYKKLLPWELLQNMDMLIKDYRGDKGLQQKQWRPVRQKIANWHEFHNNRSNNSAPPLSYRDGGSFLLIRQERPGAAPLLHRLHGTSRKLYLYCQTIRSLDDITSRFPQLAQKTILKFFEDIVKKLLLYQENNRFLALAIRENRYY